MKILVTGGSGQLGKCLKDSADKYDSDNDYYFFDHNELNIADYGSICEKLDSIEPNFVINCAAYVKSDDADSEKLNAYMTNAMGPTYLAIACKERGIYLIHISTDYVFDGTKTTAYEVDDKCNPINTYGATKYCGEEAIRSIYPEAVIIRTSWLYSEYGNNFLTKTLRNIDTFTKVGKTLNYLIDQVGCPTYARNLSDFIIKELIVPQYAIDFKALNTIYHYTDDGVASRYDFARAIERMIYRPCMNIDYDTESVINGTVSNLFTDKIKRPQCCVLSKTAVLNDFNIKLKDWQDSLYDCASHFLADAQLMKDILR